MKTIFGLAALTLAIGAGPASAGCVTGAVVGGVAGHMAGHGVLGAAAGCAVGHHEKVKHEKQAKAAKAAQPPAASGSGTPTQSN